MNNKAKISICIPFRNVSKYVKEAFDSILAQTYKNWEVIVFNDGSSKSEREKLIQHIKVFTNNYKLIDSDNIGLFAARCKMFNKATGDIIVSLDSDDYLFDKNALKIIANEIKNGFDMVIYNNTRSLDGKKNKNFNSIENNIESVRKNFCLWDNLNNIWIKAFKKEVFDSCNFEQNKYLNMCEDVYMSTFLLDKINKVKVIDKPLYFYRVNEESIIHKEFDEYRLQSQEFVEKNLAKYAKKWSIKEFNFAKHWFEYMVYGNILYANKNFPKNKKHEIYNLVYSYKYTKKCLSSLDIRRLDIPKHKKIPLSLFVKKKYFALDFYFYILELSKKFLR